MSKAGTPARGSRLDARSVARPTLLAALIYAALSLALFGQGLLPGRVLSSSDQLWTAVPWSASAPSLSTPLGANPELADSVVVFEPFLEYTRERLPDLPLWNPHIMAGRPFLADAQSAVLSPFSVPSYVLPRDLSFAITAALKVFVGAFGTFLFARALGLGIAGAFLAGVVYGFGQFTVDWVTWPQSSIRVLLPWLLLLVEALLKRPRALPVLGLAVVVALQFFGGHPETSYDVLVVTVAFALFRLLELKRRDQPVWRPALAVALGLAAGIALAAVAIVPFVELLLHSSDLESRKLLTGGHVPPGYLLGLVMPTYWGRPTDTGIFLSETLMVDRAFYAGALPLMLAAGALMRPSMRRVALTAGGLGSLAVVVGVEPFLSIAEKFPGPVRTDRLTFLFLFAVALLAGVGLDDLVRARLGAIQRQMLLGVSALVVCFPLVYVAVVERPALQHLDAALRLAWGFRPPAEAFTAGSRDDVIHLAALSEWLPLAAAGAALLALRAQRRLAASSFATMAVALVVADLFKLGMGFNPAITTTQAEQPATGAVQFLQRAGLTRFAGVDSDRPSVVPPPLPADVGMRYDLYDARGRDFPVIDRFTTLWARNVAPVLPAPHFDLPAPDARALRALSLLSVGYLLQDPRDPPLDLPGLILAYEGRDARVYRNERALPRAFVVGAQRVVATGEQAVEAVESPSFDAGSTAVTENRIPGVPTAASPGPPDVGTASITSYEPERLVIRARATRRSVLVLTDSYFPGWSAEIDGKPTDIERVDYLLRGVRLPPGVHEVTFSYRPSSYRVGWIVSLGTLLLLLGTALLIWRRRVA